MITESKSWIKNSFIWTWIDKSTLCQSVTHKSVCFLITYVLVHMIMIYKHIIETEIQACKITMYKSKWCTVICGTWLTLINASLWMANSCSKMLRHVWCSCGTGSVNCVMHIPENDPPCYNSCPPILMILIPRGTVITLSNKTWYWIEYNNDLYWKYIEF